MRAAGRAVAGNVGAAYKWSLEWIVYLAGLGDRTVTEGKGEIKFNLNTKFDLVNLSPDERRLLLEEWQKGALTDEEYRNNLTNAGIATDDFDTWQKNRDEKADADVANAAKLEGAIAKAAVEAAPPSEE